MSSQAQAAPRLAQRPAVFWLLALAILAANVLFTAQHPVQLGQPAPEWPVAVDLLLVIPLLYLGLNFRRGKAVLAPLAMLLGLGILAGSFIVPTESKQLWRVLEPLRYLAVGAVLLAQACVLAWVVGQIVRARGRENLELAVHRAVRRWVPDATLARLFRLEGRVWLYALRRRASPFPFPGERHFPVARQGLNASNQLGFLILLGAEIPVAHLIIALFDPGLALIVSAFTAYGFVFMLAEYRATLQRPLSTDAQGLHLRYGVFTDGFLPWTSVVAVHPWQGRAQRERGTLRLVGMGAANVALVLAPGTRVEQPSGAREVQRIVLGVDDPAAFVGEVQLRLASRSVVP